FSEPRCLDEGFLRNKPIVLKDNSWMNCNYNMNCDRYGFSISKDNGGTFEHRHASKKLPTPFDETMAYQKTDGSIRLLARNSLGTIAESTSYDNGESWTETKSSGIVNPNSRFYIGRTPSGRVLLVNNDSSTERTNLTLYLSEDDGETWKYKRCIDSRPEVSYPDIDYHDGRIYLIYDRERYDAREILLAVFSEEDIISPENPIEILTVSNSDAEPTPKADRDGKPYLLADAEKGRHVR
nr:exo-alpha-sialidase [Clostridia bacterium]